MPVLSSSWYDALTSWSLWPDPEMCFSDFCQQTGDAVFKQNVDSKVWSSFLKRVSEAFEDGYLFSRGYENLVGTFISIGTETIIAMKSLLSCLTANKKQVKRPQRPETSLSVTI